MTSRRCSTFSRSEPETWDRFSAPHGPGRRLTVEGTTVAGFHLFGVADDDDPRDGADRHLHHRHLDRRIPRVGRSLSVLVMRSSGVPPIPSGVPSTAGTGPHSPDGTTRDSLTIARLGQISRPSHGRGHWFKSSTAHHKWNVRAIEVRSPGGAKLASLLGRFSHPRRRAGQEDPGRRTGGEPHRRSRCARSRTTRRESP